MKRKVQGLTKIQRQNTRHESQYLIWIIKYGLGHDSSVITQTEGTTLFICTYTKYVFQNDRLLVLNCCVMTETWSICTFQKPRCYVERNSMHVVIMFSCWGKKKQQLCFTGNSAWLSLFHVEAIRSIMKSLDQEWEFQAGWSMQASWGDGLPTFLLQKQDAALFHSSLLLLTYYRIQKLSSRTYLNYFGTCTIMIRDSVVLSLFNQCYY